MRPDRRQIAVDTRPTDPVPCRTCRPGGMSDPVPCHTHRPGGMSTPPTILTPAPARTA